METNPPVAQFPREGSVKFHLSCLSPQPLGLSHSKRFLFPFLQPPALGKVGRAGSKLGQRGKNDTWRMGGDPAGSLVTWTFPVPHWISLRISCLLVYPWSLRNNPGFINVKASHGFPEVVLQGISCWQKHRKQQWKGCAGSTSVPESLCRSATLPEGGLLASGAGKTG